MSAKGYLFTYFLIFWVNLSLSLVSTKLEASVFKKNSRENGFTYSLYRVKPGDSLSVIAQRFKVSVRYLKMINHFSDSDIIKSGHRIRVSRSRNKSSIRADRIHNRSGLLNKLFVKRNLSSITKSDVKLKRSFSKYYKRYEPLNTYRCSSGVYMKAVKTGIVKRVGIMRGFGRYIILKHSKKIETLYCGLDFIQVSPGQVIRQGDVLGKCSEDYVGFMVLKNGKPKNPRIVFN